MKYNYSKIDSTNTVAKKLAAEGAKHGTLVTAEEQTSGQGRRGRSFFSPPGHGVYMSLVLEPERLGFKNFSFVTLHTAVAVCEAIEQRCGKKPSIKWVNDIFLNGKKICGISADYLAEAQRIVVGIGVNFTTPPNIPSELRNIIGAVFLENETAPLSRDEFIDELAARVVQAQKNVLQKYRSRLFMLGQRVRVEAEPAYEATALDINEEGQLLVQANNGKTITLAAGEISVRPSGL